MKGLSDENAELLDSIIEDHAKCMGMKSQDVNLIIHVNFNVYVNKTARRFGAGMLLPWKAEPFLAHGNSAKYTDIQLVRTNVQPVQSEGSIFQN